MKKHVRSVLSLILLLGVLTANLMPVQAVEPRYTGIFKLNSFLDISSTGAAECKGEAGCYSGYTIDITVELKRDGTTIKTWTSSGSGTVQAGGTYYVLSGHNYVVTTTATVYKSNGQWVESPSADSIEEYY